MPVVWQLLSDYTHFMIPSLTCSYPRFTRIRGRDLSVAVWRAEYSGFSISSFFMDMIKVNAVSEECLRSIFSWFPVSPYVSIQVLNVTRNGFPYFTVYHKHFPSSAITRRSSQTCSHAFFCFQTSTAAGFNGALATSATFPTGF